MQKTVIVIGIGEIGSVFARGLLKAGYTVVPVVRGADPAAVAKETPAPEAVIVAVGEKDLQSVLASVPQVWQDRLVLVQNELLPRDWERHGLEPTVVSVWFEKKKGQDTKVLIPSPVFGPRAQLVKAALSSLDIDCNVIASADRLLYELVLKNLYILTVNIAGLKVGGTVGELWKDHQDLARAVAADVLDIQFNLAGQELDREELIAGMLAAFDGDPAHKCMGRSAPARLARAIAIADEHSLAVKTLRSVQSEANPTAV